jgi:Ribonuclease G/E
MTPPPADADEPEPRVRVRGIYATALTNYFSAGDRPGEVVQPSTPIANRFDEDLPNEPPTVTVEMTRDRQGVEVSGASDAVTDVRSALDDIAIDTLSWADVAASGAVFAGTVAETKGRGAIVSLADDREGFLPFGQVDGYVDEGDAVRVQVTEPRAPWERGRPVLDTGLRVPGDGLTLVSGVDALVAETPDGTPTHELVRTTELLGTDVPDGWGIAWETGAEDLSVAELDAALSTAVDRVESLEADLEAASDEGRLAAPLETVWVWFGRASRFALDESRRDVSPTMVGHHRAKAGDELASSAVDFAEHLGVETEGFPFAAVTASFGPDVGDRIAIGHGKPDGRYVQLGRGEVTDVAVEKERVTLERTMSGGGTYDALDVPRVEGDVATTRFTEGRWWYPTIYRSEDGDLRGTYVNVSTPVEIFPDEVRYVDLHVDVIKHVDGTVTVVDEDELEDSVAAGDVAAPLAEKAMSVASQVANALGD